MRFSNVDLPDPLAPNRQISSPARAARETPSTARTVSAEVSKCRETPDISTTTCSRSCNDPSAPTAPPFLSCNALAAT